MNRWSAKNGLKEAIEQYIYLSTDSAIELCLYAHYFAATRLTS